MVLGVATDPVLYFPDDRCRYFTERFLRYVVARWGSSPHVHSWELFNEVDGVQTYIEAQVADWHQWAKAVLRSWDVVGQHPVSTSFAQPPGSSIIDPGMDFTQTHSYGASDMAASAQSWIAKKLAAYGTPTFMGEFGLPDPTTTCNEDCSGIYLVNGLLAPLLSGGAGTSMTWWW